MSRILGALGQALAAGSITQSCAGHVGALSPKVSCLLRVLAVLAGVVLGYFRFLHSLLATLIELLRPMPSVAIIPVAILLLGIGDGMIVSVTVYASLWPILINTIDGVRNIDAHADRYRPHLRSQPLADSLANHSAWRVAVISSPDCASACRSR